MVNKGSVATFYVEDFMKSSGPLYKQQQNALTMTPRRSRVQVFDDLPTGGHTRHTQLAVCCKGSITNPLVIGNSVFFLKDFLP